MNAVNRYAHYKRGGGGPDNNPKRPGGSPACDLHHEADHSGKYRHYPCQGLLDPVPHNVKVALLNREVKEPLHRRSGWAPLGQARDIPGMILLDEQPPSAEAPGSSGDGT